MNRACNGKLHRQSLIFTDGAPARVAPTYIALAILLVLASGWQTAKAQPYVFVSNAGWSHSLLILNATVLLSPSLQPVSLVLEGGFMTCRK